MVSSKYEKVYVKVQHPDVYEGTKIEFNADDKQKVWKVLNEIDFFSYPDKYSPKPPKDTLPQFEIIKLLLPDSDSIEIDTLWYLPKIYDLVDTSIPYSAYSITVYFLGKKKTVRWRGDQILREMGSEQEIIDPKFENLYRVGHLIYSITKKKKGFKNLPKSGLEYY